MDVRAAHIRAVVLAVHVLAAYFRVADLHSTQVGVNLEDYLRNPFAELPSSQRARRSSGPPTFSVKIEMGGSSKLVHIDHSSSFFGSKVVLTIQRRLLWAVDLSQSYPA